MALPNTSAIPCVVGPVDLAVVKGAGERLRRINKVRIEAQDVIPDGCSTMCSKACVTRQAATDWLSRNG